MELEKLTALQLADKIKKHEVSVLDGVKDVFSKIEEKYPTYYCVITIDKSYAAMPH